jgi:hypothetical protein
LFTPSFTQTLQALPLFRLQASEREQFFSLLEDIANNWKQKITLVIVLRSNQLNQLLELTPSWSNLVESNLAIVPPMSVAELRKAIEGPAEGAGLAIEPGLTDLILRDAADAPGALPLVQNILYGLWERKQQGYLTVEAYEALGGTTGSLQRQAEACFASFDPQDQEKAMTILLRLVQVTPEGEYVRRLARFDELMAAGPPDDVRRIVDAMVDARLLVVNSKHGSDALVDLAHEAILRNWPRLRQQGHFCYCGRGWISLRRVGESTAKMLGSSIREAKSACSNSRDNWSDIGTNLANPNENLLVQANGKSSGSADVTV